MTIDLDEEAGPRIATFVRESTDRYVQLSREDGRGAERYTRVEQQFWLNASSYSIHCALLSDASVEWRDRHIASVFQELAKSEEHNAPGVKPLPSPVSIEDRQDIQISAPVMIQGRSQLGFISETGIRPFIGQLLLEVCIGPRECSSIRHLNSSSEASDETTYISVFIGEEEMKWLRAELHRRPDASLTAFIRTRVFQEESEMPGVAPVRPQRFFIEQGGITRITQATLHIGEPEHPKAPVPNEHTQAPSPHFTALEPSQELSEDESISADPSPFSEGAWEADGSAQPMPRKRPSLAIYLVIALQLLIILALFVRK